MLFPLVAMAFLCGCGESAHEKEMDKQIAKLQEQYSYVTNQLNNLLAVQQDNIVVQTNLAAMVEEAMTLARANETSSSLPVSPVINPQTGLPYDPRTGLPIDQPLVSSKATGRVTESNDMWWRWSVKFAIGNPNPYQQTTSATIKFLDAEGYVIDTKTEYNLSVPGYSTNMFTTYELVDLPAAANVKSLDVKLEQ